MSEEKKSTHKVEVVPVVLEPHPNADTLSIIPVFGYTYCAKTEQWQGVKLAAYLPPDSVVDVSRPEFAFLAKDAKDGKVRIKARKLRGIVSFGLMVPAPESAKEGDDVAELLGVEHYEPKTEQETGGANMSGECASPPSIPVAKYDLDAFRRYAAVFERLEPVVVTEKLDGTNCRYVYHDGEMHCGSRTEWKRAYPDLSFFTVENMLARVGDEAKAKEIVERVHSQKQEKNFWWKLLERTPALEKFCRDNPGVVVYGEGFGYVQKLRYGHAQGEFSFAAFDIMKDGRWLDAPEAIGIAEDAGIPWVPILYRAHPYDFDMLCEMAEGKTTWPGADHVREGVVVCPVKERYDRRTGRVKLKIVGAGYLEKSR